MYANASTSLLPRLMSSGIVLLSIKLNSMYTWDVWRRDLKRFVLKSVKTLLDKCTQLVRNISIYHWYFTHHKKFTHYQSFKLQFHYLNFVSGSWLAIQPCFCSDTKEYIIWSVFILGTSRLGRTTLFDKSQENRCKSRIKSISHIFGSRICMSKYIKELKAFHS